MTDLESLYEYIELPLSAAMLGKSWDDPNDIRPGNFIAFFAYYDEGAGSKYNLKYPTDEYEKYIRSYFDVSTEHLRQAEGYDEYNSVYVCDGIGAGPEAAVTSARMENDILFISFDVFSPAGAGEVVWSGETQIRFTDNGHRYIANEKFDINTEQQTTEQNSNIPAPNPSASLGSAENPIAEEPQLKEEVEEMPIDDNNAHLHPDNPSPPKTQVHQSSTEQNSGSSQTQAEPFEGTAK